MQVYSASQGKVIDIPDTQGSSYQDAPSKNITGRSLEDHAAALNAAKAAGDTQAIKQITDDYDREYSYQKDIVNPAQKVSQDRKIKKDEGDKAVKGLLNTLGQLKEDSAKAGVGNVIGGALGVDSTIQQFETKRALAAQFLAKAVENGRLSDKDRDFYQKIVSINPIGLQNPKNQQIDSLIDNISTLTQVERTSPRSEDVGVTGEIIDGVKKAFEPATTVAQDLGVGAAMNAEPGYQKSQYDAIAMAQQVMARAQTEKDPEQKARLEQTGKDIFAQVGMNAEQIAGAFSTEVSADPFSRGLGAAATIAGAAELGANPVAVAKGVAQPFLHPIQTAKAVGTVAKNPIVAGKEILKRDLANSGYKGTGLPGGTPSVVEGPMPEMSGPQAVSSAKEMPNIATEAENLTPQELAAKKSRETLQAPPPINQKPVDKQLQHSVRNIRLDSSVYGHGQEEAVNETMDALGFEGDAGQQYAMLQPKMDQLGEFIEKQMSVNPKLDTIDEIVKDFDKNLAKKGIYRSGQLSRDKAQTKIRSYINDLYMDATGSKVIPTQIPDTELFALKKLVNDDYGRVAKKLVNGLPLTDEEKIIYVARQTLDDRISALHPTLKKATTMQSHLYDGTDSLYKSRDEKGVSTSILGSKVGIPGKVVQKVKDYVGKIVGNNTPGAVPELVFPSEEAAQSTGPIINQQMPSFAPGGKPDDTVIPIPSTKYIRDRRMKIDNPKALKKKS